MRRSSAKFSPLLTILVQGPVSLIEGSGFILGSSSGCEWITFTSRQLSPLISCYQVSHDLFDLLHNSHPPSHWTNRFHRMIITGRCEGDWLRKEWLSKLFKWRRSVRLADWSHLISSKGGGVEMMGLFLFCGDDNPGHGSAHSHLSKVLRFEVLSFMCNLVLGRWRFVQSIIISERIFIHCTFFAAQKC